MNNRDVILEPYKLFQRLSVAAERQVSLSDSLAYELTIFPTSLFDDNYFMRESKKFRLGNYLKVKVSPLSESCSAELTVIDGGWLLHQLPWQRDKVFAEIGEEYVCLVKSKGRRQGCCVVFDGYNPSTKDHEHERRSKNSVGGVEIQVVAS